MIDFCYPLLNERRYERAGYIGRGRNSSSHTASCIYEGGHTLGVANDKLSFKAGDSSFRALVNKLSFKAECCADKEQKKSEAASQGRETFFIMQNSKSAQGN